MRELRILMSGQDFTRRGFLAGCAASLAGGQSEAEQSAILLPLPVVVDSSETCEAQVVALASLGVKAVFRYYALKKQSQLPTKRITKSEADAILEAGLSLGIAYQYMNSSLPTFNVVRAEMDADTCFEQGEVINQAIGSTIYFGVDNDFNAPEHVRSIIGYFEKINDLFAARGGPYRVGVYGPGAICGELFQRRLVEHTWIAGFSTGWSGGPAFYNQGSWNLFQNALELPIGNIRLDTNIVNIAAPKIGAFDKARSVNAIGNNAVFRAQLFLTREEKLWTSPGGAVIANLSKRKMVTAISVAGDFTLIDVAFQVKVGNVLAGRIRRGFCRTDALTSIDNMPS
jgi:Domain of unknown function (DUF1906)